MHKMGKMMLLMLRMMVLLLTMIVLLTRIASFTFFAGTGVGVFAAGTLSDKIGRRVTVLLFIALFVAR